MGQLDGKVAIVTGGGSGIGKGIARAFADEGCNVMIAARNTERLDSTVDELRESPGTVVSCGVDVTDEASVVALFRTTIARFGKLDVLVNNSGVAFGAEVGDITLELWESVTTVNIRGVFLCTREAFRIMKEAGGGRIINIGSISSTSPRANSAAYTTSKHAITGLTRSAALDGRPYGISCGQLNPGNTSVEWRVEVMASGEVPTEPMIEVPDMARGALFMATLPPEANALEVTVLPVEQAYLGRA